MITLGIETSCDETSVAVLRGRREVLSNEIFTQQDLHSPYGGVVPEIASRSHLEKLPIVMRDALQKAGMGWGDIDRIAATYGPGLASSLMIGFSAAKGLAVRQDLPLVAVNHLHGHIFSAFLSEDAPEVEETCPFLALVVSGGHTCLVHVERPGEYHVLGQTVDDAAGEAFDKGAHLLGLGYPGGPVLDRVGRTGNPAAVSFPKIRVKKPRGSVAAGQEALMFSYSGLKTALLYHLQQNPGIADDEQRLADVVASYQEAIVDSLVSRCAQAMESYSTLALGGGVSLNSRLRAKLAEAASQGGWQLLMTEPRFCADNAAMIAGVAGLGLGVQGDGALALDVVPSLPIDSV